MTEHEDFQHHNAEINGVVYSVCYKVITDFGIYDLVPCRKCGKEDVAVFNYHDVTLTEVLLADKMIDLEDKVIEEQIKAIVLEMHLSDVSRDDICYECDFKIKERFNK